MRTSVSLLVLLLTALPCFSQLWNVAIPNRAVYSITVDPSAPALVYAGNVSRTFLKSTDGGVTWDERLIQDGGGASLITVFKVHPKKGNILLAAGIGFNGLDRSEDFGETWTNVLTSSDGSRFELISSSSLAFDPVHPDTIYAIRSNNGAVYRSMNAGATWDSLSTLPGLVGTDVMRAIAVSPDSTNVLTASGRRAYQYRSNDGGATWALAPGTIGPQPDMDVANMEWSRTTPGTVYAVAGYSLRQNTTNGGIIVSTDYGLNWTRLRCTDTSLYALLVHKTPSGDELYVGGNQIDLPPDPGYIKGDSLVFRYKLKDSSLFDLSNVPWTENEIGEIGVNVWGFAVTLRSGVETLLMCSTGGAFSSDYLTSVNGEPVQHIASDDLRVIANSSSLTMMFNNAPGRSRYRVSTLDGRVVMEGDWDGNNNSHTLSMSWSTASVYLVENLSESTHNRTLIIR